jgi:hypothetical protein
MLVFVLVETREQILQNEAAYLTSIRERLARQGIVFKLSGAGRST